MHDRSLMSSHLPRQRALQSMLPSRPASISLHSQAFVMSCIGLREWLLRVARGLLACAACIMPASPLHAQAGVMSASAPVPHAPVSDAPGVGGASAPLAGLRAGAQPDASFGARQAQLNRRSELNQYEYGVARHHCYSTFLVNHCLEKVRDKMIANKVLIRNAQNALDNERRAAHARQRDEQAALRREADALSAPQRAARERENEVSYAEKQRQHAIDEARRNAQAPQRAASQRAYDRKQGNYQRKLEQARQQGAQNAEQRAQNVRRFDEKQRRAAEHAADVRERQARAAQKQAASEPAAASGAQQDGK